MAKVQAKVQDSARDDGMREKMIAVNRVTKVVKGGRILGFAALTVVATLLSRRLIQKVNPSDAPDINARDVRLIGQRAQVVQAFVDGRGRVFVSGAEWVAEIEGATPAEGDSVIVEGMDGPKLKVRAA